MWNLLDVTTFVALYVAVGIAILRHRLYDIDVIINRTLVYSALTATLVALYFGGIVVLQRLFEALAGEKSTLAVVASTLVIAALFNPLRRHIQSFIDRRFYRRKYDAIKTLEAFSSKLREETDLEPLSDDLVGVVKETMQPPHTSLWLRPVKRLSPHPEHELRATNVLRPYCNRADTHWYTTDTSLALAHRKPPKQAQFPDAPVRARTHSSKLVMRVGQRFESARRLSVRYYLPPVLGSQ